MMCDVVDVFDRLSCDVPRLCDVEFCLDVFALLLPLCCVVRCVCCVYVDC